MKKNTTKRSLALSVLSLVICVAMLLGTTFAWFTDSVTSGVNKIVAGNLDIELEYTTDGSTWNPVTNTTKLFKDGALWEPGYTEVAYLRLSNKGTLALKYNLAINVANEVAGTNVAGESFKLSDYIRMGVVENWNGTVYADRPAARTAVGEAGNIATYTKAGNMLAGADAVKFAIVAFMPEEVGNEANYKTGTTAPSIELGVSVVATQYTSESDSFGSDYDAGTPWLGGTAEVPEEKDGAITITTAEELAGFAAAVNGGNDYNGKTIKLAKDIDLNNVAWTPIGSSSHAFNGTFDGQNHTVLNLNVNSNNYAGLFGNAFNHGVIKNIKVVNATVSGHNKVGVILGGGYADITNCDVEKATVTATTWLVDGSWDDGDKAGAVVGQVKESAAYTVQDCDVKDVTVTGYRDVGGIAGYGYAENVFKNNTATNVTIINDRTHNYQNYTTDAAYDVREIVGEYANTVDPSNVATNVTISKIVPVELPEDATAEQTQNAVNNAVAAANAGDIVVLPNTDAGVKLPTTKAGVTLKGDGTTKIDATAALPNINDAILDGFVMECGQSNYHGFTHSDAVIKNCTISGLLFSYNAGGEQVFENCTFINNKDSGEYNMWAYGNVSYKNCTFKSYGKFVNVYNEGTAHFDVNFDGCTFINLKSTGNKAGINVKDTSASNQLNITVNINNCNYQGVAPTNHGTATFFNNVVQIDDIGSNTTKVKIIQDGATLWPQA